MPQLHFSVDEDTARRLAAEAERRGLSVSTLIAELVTRELPVAWPAGYLENVIGSCRAHPIGPISDLDLDDVDLEAP